MRDAEKRYEDDKRTKEQMEQRKEIITQMKTDMEPKIVEANEIAGVLGKDVKFSSMYTTSLNQATSLSQVSVQNSDVQDLMKKQKEKLQVKVEDFVNNQIYFWTPEQF